MSRLRRIFLEPFSPYVAAVLLALGSALFALALGGKLWGITTGESQLGGHFVEALGWQVDELPYFQKFSLPPILTSGPQVHVFGLLLGGLLAALLLGEFAIRAVPGRRQFVAAVVGGILLGYGSRLAAGCNIGNFWSAFPSAGVNAVTFFAGVLLGAFLTVRTVVERGLLLSPPWRLSVTFLPRRQRILGVIVLAFLIALTLVAQPSLVVGAWLWFGVFAAYVGYRSRLCFASAYRDLFVRGARSGRNAAAVAFGLLLQAAIFLPLALGGTKLDYSLAAGQGQFQVLIGGFLFGIGAVLLGGCIFSSAYRAGAGQVTALIGWLSTVFVGMPLLSLHWDFWYNAVPRFLPRATLWDYGPSYGLLIAGLVPAAWLLYALRADGALPRILSRKRRAVEGA